MLWEHRKKFRFVCHCKFFLIAKVELGLKNSCDRGVGSTGSFLHAGLALCEQACTRFELQILQYCFLLPQWPHNLHVTFAGCFRWASGGTWKLWSGPWTGPFLNYQVWCWGTWSWLTGQDSNVTQSARPRLGKSAQAGTLSQWLYDSESEFQSTRAAGGLTCQH